MIFRRANWFVNAIVGSVLGGCTFAVGTAFAETPDSPANAEHIKVEAESAAKIWTAESYQRSVKLFLDAASRFRARNMFPEAAACLREAAVLELSLGSGASTGHAIKALELDSKSRNSRGLALDLEALTLASLRSNNISEAEKYSAQALATAKQSRDPAALGGAYFAAGEVSIERQDFRTALDRQLIALDNFRKSDDKDGEAQTLVAAGFSFIINNQRYLGLEFTRKGLELSESLNNARIKAFALIIRGEGFSRIGEWQTAIRTLHEVESHFPEGLDKLEKATLLTRIGRYYLTYGELRTARDYLQRSIELYEAVNYGLGVSEISTILGQISARLGDDSVALSYFARAHELLKKTDVTGLGLVDENLGEFYFERGNPELAGGYLRSALTNFEKSGIKHAIARVKIAIGRLGEQQGNLTLARVNYESALALNREISGVDGAADALFDLARLDLGSNNFDSALTRNSESLSLTEQLQEKSGSDLLRSSFRSLSYERYLQQVEILMKLDSVSPNGDFAIRALQAAERARARSILENLALAEAGSEAPADNAVAEKEKELRESLNDRSDELTNLLRSDGTRAEIDTVESQIGALEHQLDEIRGEQLTANPAYAAAKNPAPLDVSSFRRDVLDVNSVLLEYTLGKYASYLWVVDKNEIKAFRLPPSADLEKKIDLLRRSMTAPKPVDGDSYRERQARIAQAEATYSPLAHEVSDLILGPAADKLQGKRLMIVPDGGLNYLPISALPRPNSASDDPLLLTDDVLLEPSAAALALLEAKRAVDTTRRTRDLLVFSDPVFSRDDARFSILTSEQRSGDPPIARFGPTDSFDSLPRLPASGDEARAITDIVGNARTDVFSGFAATRQRLMETDLSQYKVLHFATHGFVDQERPELSAIVLSRFDASGGEIDEAVRPRDIYAMKLNADLVVLSSCETATGKEVKGEGVMGLNNAFLQAGARSVVASLWQVEDNATNLFMREFYSGMVKGLTASDALRQAKIKLYRDPQFSSPFFWAAFTIEGDGGFRPEISHRLPPMVWAAAAALIALTAGFLFRKRLAKLLLSRWPIRR